MLSHSKQGAGWVCQHRYGGSPVPCCEQCPFDECREAFEPGMLPQAAGPWIWAHGAFPGGMAWEEVVPCKG